MVCYVLSLTQRRQLDLHETDGGLLATKFGYSAAKVNYKLYSHKLYNTKCNETDISIAVSINKGDVIPIRGSAIGNVTHKQPLLPTEFDGTFISNIKSLFNVEVKFLETTTQNETTKRSVAFIPPLIINQNTCRRSRQLPGKTTFIHVCGKFIKTVRVNTKQNIFRVNFTSGLPVLIIGLYPCTGTEALYRPYGL
jgi:hypothetical protein